MAKVLTEKSNYEDIADAIREKNGTGETYLPSEMAGAIRSIHGDVTGVKGDSESSYRTGNVNLTPANIGAKATQTPVASPSASGTAVAFIDSITQNAQGVITPTKKSVRIATASQSGLMSAADKTNLDNLQTRMTAAEDEMDILAIYPTASGKGAMVTVDGTVDAPPAELVIYGKSVQNGTPTPSAPADIVTAGSGGTLAMVSVAAGTDIHNSATDTAQFIDENGNITDNADYLLTDYIPLSGNYLYIRWEDVVGTACYLRRAYYDSNKSFIRRDIHQLTRGQSGTFWTPLATARYVRICVENSSTNRISGLQVHDGYGVAIPTPNGLPGVPVTSGGNYTDTDEQDWICDTIDLEKGTWTKRVGVVTLDGSDDEGWTLSANLNYIYGFSGAYGVSIGLVVDQSNAFPHMTTWSIGREIDTYVGNNVQVGESYISGGAKLWIRTNYSTIETFKAALADHPMTFVFPLVTPVTTQLTAEQIAALRALRGRKSLTYMYSTDPAGPEFRAEMYIDIPTYINEREPEIIDVAVETVMELLTDDVALSGITVTPSPYNRFRPYFQPWIKEYTLSVVKGDTITITPHTDNSDLTVEFENIQTTTAQYYTMHIANGACELTFMGTGYDRGISILVSDGSRTVTYFVNLICAE